MKFDKLDPSIRSWAKRKQIPFATQYQDVEVRSFEITGSAGRAQIWVDVEGNSTSVHVWDYRKRKQSFDVLSKVEVELDRALEQARKWCGSHP